MLYFLITACQTLQVLVKHAAVCLSATTVLNPDIVKESPTYTNIKLACCDWRNRPIRRISNFLESEKTDFTDLLEMFLLWP